MTVTITTQGNPVNIASDHQTVNVNMTNYDTSSVALVAASSASASAAQAALYDGPKFNDAQAVIADTVLSYVSGAGKTVVAVGSYITTRKEGFAYQVAASGASDQHLTTAGGVKLYVAAAQDYGRSVLALGALGDGTSDDTPEFTLATAARTAQTNLYQLPIGTYPITTQQSLVGYVQLNGQGDQSQVKISSGTAFAYTSQSGVFDDHPHNATKNFRITGNGTLVAYPGDQNGTTKGISFAEVDSIGNLAFSEGMTYELHAIGRHIKKSYGHVGTRNYYRANKVGLLLENVTSYMERDVYARYNSDAAIRIIGGQNVTISNGAIEGNPGKGIDVVLDAAYLWGQLNLENLYFESNGNQASATGWSIDIPWNTNTNVNVTGGSYWSNVVGGRTSGPYRMGPSLSVTGATMNGSFYAKEVTRFDNVRGPGPGTWNTMGSEALSRQFGLVEPAIFHQFSPTAYEHAFTAAATGGLILATKPMGRSNMLVPDAPNIGSYSYPFGMTASGGAVASVDTALNYGDGDWLKCTYAASVGSFSSNYLTLASFADTTKQFRTFVCLVRAESACEIGFVQSIGGQATTGYFALEANKTYRMVFCAFAPMTAGSFLRMFPLNAAGPIVNVLPMWQSQHSTYVSQLKTLEMLVSDSSGGSVTLFGSATFDPASLVDGAGLTTTVTVTGAALGDFVEVSFGLNLNGIIVTAWVSAANTVSVRFQNETGGTLDLASSTLRVRVKK